MWCHMSIKERHTNCFTAEHEFERRENGWILPFFCTRIWRQWSLFPNLSLSIKWCIGFENVEGTLELKQKTILDSLRALLKLFVSPDQHPGTVWHQIPHSAPDTGPWFPCVGKVVSERRVSCTPSPCPQVRHISLIGDCSIQWIREVSTLKQS